MDRLVAAVAGLAEDHDVFIQTGSSRLQPSCPHADFIGFDEVQRRIVDADVVITHAGNSVRLVQRAGKVPVVVAREVVRGELRNHHQEVYVHDPDVLGPAVVLSGELEDLPAAVARHAHVEPTLLAGAVDRDDPERAGEVLDQVLGAVGSGGAVGREPRNPFRDDPIRRYAWAWSQLDGRTGTHLELGIGQGAPFLGPLATSTELDLVAVDPHPEYVTESREVLPGLAVVRTEVGGRLPFPAACFDSATMLDVLEHVADEEVSLSELARVLRPGALLVVTVPARHLLSFLDPDDAKLRVPNLHRLAYTARFGAYVYRRRFVDRGDGLRGDLAWNRTRHTNYRARPLIERVSAHGFQPRWRDGANLLGRLIHAAALLGGSSTGRLLDPVLLADGLAFHRANLFLTFERSADPAAVPAPLGGRPSAREAARTAQVDPGQPRPADARP